MCVRGQLQGVNSLLCGSWGQTPVSRHLYQLSHLSGPHISINEIIIIPHTVVAIDNYLGLSPFIIQFSRCSYLINYPEHRCYMDSWSISSHNRNMLAVGSSLL